MHHDARDRPRSVAERPMKLLFVTPCTYSSGEAVTALHIAARAATHGADVRFVASRFTAALIEPSFPGAVERLSEDAKANRSVLFDTIARFRPQAIVFADWAHLFFSSGVAPFGGEDLKDALDRVDAALLALDHVGCAQGAPELRFGPSFLRGVERLVALPDRA